MYINVLGDVGGRGIRTLDTVLRLGCFKSAHIDTLSVTLKVTGSNLYRRQSQFSVVSRPRNHLNLLSPLLV